LPIKKKGVYCTEFNKQIKTTIMTNNNQKANKMKIPLITFFAALTIYLLTTQIF